MWGRQAHTYIASGEIASVFVCHIAAGGSAAGGSAGGGVGVEGGSPPTQEMQGGSGGTQSHPVTSIISCRYRFGSASFVSVGNDCIGWWPKTLSSNRLELSLGILKLQSGGQEGPERPS